MHYGKVLPFGENDLQTISFSSQILEMQEKQYWHMA